MEFSTIFNKHLFVICKCVKMTRDDSFLSKRVELNLSWAARYKYARNIDLKVSSPGTLNQTFSNAWNKSLLRLEGGVLAIFSDLILRWRGPGEEGSGWGWSTWWGECPGPPPGQGLQGRGRGEAGGVLLWAEGDAGALHRVASLAAHCVILKYFLQ